MKQFTLFTVFALTTFSTAWADSTTPSAPASKPTAASTYKCQLLIASSDVTADKGEWNFEVGNTGASHGENGLTFNEGIHELYVAADSHWIALGWKKNGVTIAKGLFAMNPTDFAHDRVAILYEPNESGDQVSVSCSAAP